MTVNSKEENTLSIFLPRIYPLHTNQPLWCCDDPSTSEPKYCEYCYLHSCTEEERRRGNSDSRSALLAGEYQQPGGGPTLPQLCNWNSVGGNYLPPSTPSSHALPPPSPRDSACAWLTNLPVHSLPPSFTWYTGHEGHRLRDEGLSICCIILAYTATVLMMVTLRTPLLLCPSKIFRQGNQKILSLLGYFSALINNVIEALNLVWEKYVS